MAARKKAAKGKVSRTAVKPAAHLTLVTADSEEVKALEKLRDPLVVAAKALVVSDQASLDLAASMLQVDKELLKEIDKATEPSRKSAHETWQTIKTMQTSLKAPIVEADRVIRIKVQDYWDEEEKRQAEEQARLDREHAKKVAEQEAEQEHVRRVAEQQQRKKRADELAAAGDFEGSDAVLRGDAPASAPGDFEAWEDDTLPPTPEAGPVAAPAATAPKGLARTKRWVGEVTDKSELLRAIVEGKAPTSLVTIDQKILNDLARSMKGQLHYPGVQARQVTGSSVR